MQQNYTHKKIVCIGLGFRITISLRSNFNYGGNIMLDKKKALQEWKENNFGSSEGFEDNWNALTKDDYLDIWQERFENDTLDLY